MISLGLLKAEFVEGHSVYVNSGAVLTATVSMPVIGMSESESVALTQYVALDVGDTVVLVREVPVHELQGYHVYTYPVPEPPDAVALNVADCPLSIVAEEGVSRIGVTIVAWYTEL